MGRSLVVKVTCGAEDAERCNQAFTVAAAAAASGADVTLWLTGEASWFAIPDRAEQFELPLATPLVDLLTTVEALGRVRLCTQCAARRGIAEGDLRDGIEISGAATFAEQVLGEGVQALVY